MKRILILVTIVICLALSSCKVIDPCPAYEVENYQHINKRR